jgi:FkbM family methyltransferase
MSFGQIVRDALRRAGYVVHRWPINRFEGMDAALALLVRRDYRPRVVIDGGANRGQWFGAASAIFPDTAFHIVEPQAACWPDLERAARVRGRTTVHKTALSGPGIASVLMTSGGDPSNTGAFVFAASEGHPIDLDSPATTLDALFAPAVRREDRALLKLDIEATSSRRSAAPPRCSTRSRSSSAKCGSSTCTRAGGRSSPTSWRFSTPAASWCTTSTC